MEVDSHPLDINEELDKQQDFKEGKRTKWQLPPSHVSVFSNTTADNATKSKFSVNRQPFVNNPLIREEKDKSSGIGIVDERLRSSTMDNNIGAKNLNGNDNEISLEAIADALATPKLIKLSVMARAEICPKIKRARLMSTKGVAAKIREQYGYDISNTTFLYAEETLYLLEMARLDVQLGRVTLSVERARALLLHSKSHPFPETNPMKIKTCSIDEYLVYKHLSELGYRVRRRDNDVKVNVSQSSLTASRERLSPPLLPSENDNVEMKGYDEEVDEGCRMELDEEECPVQQETLGKDEVSETITPQSLSSSSSGISKSCTATASTRGTKRKFGDLSSDHTPGSATSSAKDMSDDECADDEELEFGHNIVTDCHMDAAASGSASFFHLSTSTYTVTEADSDIEIMEEPELGPSASCSNGVYIEEIGYGYDGDIEEDPSGASQEPKPSTSAACFSSNNDFPQQAVVHLADSDSETEDFSIINRVWSKFVPNSTIQIGFPPSLLLPPNIPSRDAIYEFDLKSRETARSDSDLEYFVDELSLNSSPPTSKCRNKGRSFKSWKDWRQGAKTEAQDILSESLLGQHSTVGGITEDPMQKLHLWGETEPKCKKRPDEGWRGFNIPYEIYHPSIGFTKHKNRKDCPPSYVVAVVRYDDEVPSFTGCDALVNGVPVLIGVVSDESTIMFMNPSGDPIPSLF